MSLVLTSLANANILSDELSAQFSTVICVPYLVAVHPTKDTTYGELTFSVDAGLDGQAVTWLGDPYEQPDGSFAQQGQLLEFEIDSDANHTNVAGIAYLDARTSVHLLIACDEFDEPQSLDNTAESFFYSPQISFGSPGTNNGAGSVVS